MRPVSSQESRIAEPAGDASSVLGWSAKWTSEGVDMGERGEAPNQVRTRREYGRNLCRCTDKKNKKKSLSRWHGRRAFCAGGASCCGRAGGGGGRGGGAI
jgi:hypothetical protein